MRIGILTLHFGANYGGTLQCYALYKTLTDMGHSVEVIDFQPTQVAPLIKRVIYNLSSARSLKELIQMIVSRKQGHSHAVSEKLVSVFEKFRNENLVLSGRVDENSISSLNNRYDCIVVGSDQVWGSMVRNRLTYMGDWLPSFPGKLVAYASCAINEKYPFVRRSHIRKLLSSFSAISVRDQTTQKFVHSILQKEVPIVADPTLLYDFTEFNDEKFIDKPYLFVYVLGSEIKGGNRAALQIIKEKLSLDCKIIAVSIYGEDCPYADITIKDATPQLWVNLIANSEAVYTDSFHGSLFALKFHIPFVSYYKERNRASRLHDLAKTFGFHLYHHVNEIGAYEANTRLNYISVIEELKKNSLFFLEHNI